MPVTIRRIAELAGKEILVVQIDGKAFKGRFAEMDENALVISHALEFSPNDRKWKLPAISFPPESSVEGDTVKMDKLESVKLREIIMPLKSIIRIYPLSPKMSAPEKPPVSAPTPFIRPPPVQPKSEGGYFIRSVSSTDEQDKKKW